MSSVAALAMSEADWLSLARAMKGVAKIRPANRRRNRVERRSVARVVFILYLWVSVTGVLCKLNFGMDANHFPMPSILQSKLNQMRLKIEKDTVQKQNNVLTP